MGEKENLLKRILSLSTTDPWIKSIEMSKETIAEIVKSTDISKIEHVYITGGGTSLYAAEVGKAYMEHIAGVRAEAVPCYYFRQYTDERCLGEDCCFVGISQTGKARSVLLGLQKARKNKAMAIAVSGYLDREVSQAAEYTILTDAKTEGPTAKSTSYTQAILALFLFAIEIGKAKKHLSPEEAAYWEDQLKLTIKKASELSHVKEEMDKLAGMYKDSLVHFVLGSGPNKGTAEEGALKIIEMGWITSEAEELEDYLHGRFREVDTNTPMLIIAPKGGSTEKMFDAIGAAKRIDVPTIVLTDDDDPKIAKIAKHVVKMPGGIDEYMTPLLYIIPLWLYGYRLGILRGGDPSGNRYGFTPTHYRFIEHYDQDGNLLDQDVK